MNFFLAAADNPVSHVVPHPLHENPLLRVENLGEGSNPTLFVHNGVYEFFHHQSLVDEFYRGRDGDFWSSTMWRLVYAPKARDWMLIEPRAVWLSCSKRCAGSSVTKSLDRISVT